MGSSEKLFEDAKEFRPERWFDLDTKGPAGLAVDEVLRPFSLGPRNCIGKLYGPLLSAPSDHLAAKLTLF